MEALYDAITAEPADLSAVDRSLARCRARLDHLQELQREWDLRGGSGG
jgi:hypothetical protein